MHIHLPKGFHGWREFAKEVGIIVLGVLIALGFEQVVQAWRWHEDARTTRQALAGEIEYSVLWAHERLAVEPCLRQRIGELTAKLHSGGSEWSHAPVVFGEPHDAIGQPIRTVVPLVYRAPHRPWLSDEWETAKSNGVLDHMDRKDAHNLEFIYRNINQLEALQEEENSLEPQVSFLAFDQSLEPQSRIAAFVTLARLDYLNGMEAQSARQMLSTVRTAGIPFGPMAIGRETLSLDDARKQIVRALSERYGSCVAG
jgi:hypothetical protein